MNEVGEHGQSNILFQMPRICLCNHGFFVKGFERNLPPGYSVLIACLIFAVVLCFLAV